MTEQRGRVERALRACAETGVPEDVDLWPEIRERAGIGLRRPRRSHRVPRTRVGWALAAIMALLLSTGAYAATGVLYEMFRDELPGARDPVFGEKLDMSQAQVASGAKVVVRWAYADASHVVVGFDVEDLEEGRRVAGRPADLEPIVVIDEPGYDRQIDEEFPQRVSLTDKGGNGFGVIDGGGMVSVAPDDVMRGPASNTVVFAAKGMIEPDGEHRFRLKVPLQAYPITAPGEKEARPEPAGEPFVFDFEIPVRPAPVIEIGQKVEANGLTLTLDRVIASPGRPQAVVCFDPPNDELRWGLGEDVRMGGRFWFTYPFDGGLEHGPLSAYPDGYLGTTAAEKKRCHAVGLRPDRSGDYSFSVESVEGWPRNGSVDGPEDIKEIPGPWTFDFEVPDS